MATTPDFALEPVTTQRAYTLRLRGVDPNDNAWRDALWATHEAINKGAKAFGDWLLTLRGGLSHKLVDEDVVEKKGGKSTTRQPTPEERMGRRILLALSWLSVEDERGAPSDSARVTTGGESDSVRYDKVLSAFVSILKQRGVTPGEIGDPKSEPAEQSGTWIGDCADSLKARVRSDAAWVNRSAVFDTVVKDWGIHAARDDAHKMVSFILGDDFLVLPTPKKKAKKESGEGEEEQEERRSAIKASSKGAGQRTRHPYSHLFGEGRPFGKPTRSLKLRDKWQEHLKPTLEKAGIPVPSIVKGKKKDKGDGPAHTEILREMFSKSASRMAQIVTKQRQQEADRLARKEADKELKAMEDDPEYAAALAALREDSEEYGRRVGSTEKFVLQPRQLTGWDRVVKRWKGINESDPDAAEDTRIKAVKQVQAEDEDKKFGDVNLFFRFAQERCKPVWLHNGKPDPTILDRYVKGVKARSDAEWLKVAAYRHPDEYLNPVFCQFGVSKPTIRFRRLKAFTDAPAGDDPRAVEMLLWQPKDRAGRLVLMHAVSRRMDREIGASCDAVQVGTESLPVVSRRGRLGGAAGGLTNTNSPSRVAGVFDLKEIKSRENEDDEGEGEETSKLKEPKWNGTLSTNRRDLEAIKRCIAKGDRKRAERLKDQLRWTLTVSMEMEGRGPWPRLVSESENRTPFTRTVMKDEPKDKKDYNKGLKRRMGDKYLDAIGWPWQEVNQPIIKKVAEKRKSDEGPSFVADKKAARGDKACLILSRIPGLRILSVDLGHRFAAACAVWEAISARDMVKVCSGHGHQEPRESDVFVHLTRTVKKERTKGRDKGKIVDVVETTIYRRVGENVLRDPKTFKPTNTPHPAPWARLDRQFLIKLQGEEKPARAASVDEVALVSNLAIFAGMVADDEDRLKGRRVDEVMRSAVRIATIGLKRHARVAKIAYAFNPGCPGIPGMGGSLKTITRGDDDHVSFLTAALFDWHALATDSKWEASWARELWNTHIAPLASSDFNLSEPERPVPEPSDPTYPAPAPTPAAPSRQQRRKDDKALRDERLKPIAQQLAADPAGCADLCAAFSKRWKEADGSHARVPQVKGPKETKPSAPASGWHAQLRILTDWIMGRKLARAASKGWTRNVGGLGVTRITTMRSLYQLHKAFDMRPRPHKIQGAPRLGEGNAGIAQGILDAMERMRQQRVKQIASRIVEAALGVGRHTPEKGKNPDRKRPQSQTDRPCHAVVIENLRNYRPDELQTRRENKALMNWSAGKVRKYLEEGCQLHGLHLREVMPNHTSRQCSRTGLPGMRCADVRIADFLNSQYWRKVVASARKRVDEQGTDSLDRMLRDLHDTWSKASDESKQRQATLRIPKNGADLFVAAPPGRTESTPARQATQADLNAAANIGLRALLDPDFMGKWWYVPCDTATGTPAKDKCAGAACLPLDSALPGMAPGTVAQAQPKKGRKGKNGQNESSQARSREIINAWRDVGVDGEWRIRAVYWNDVKQRVVQRLREINGLDAVRVDVPVAETETPW